jgi:penicillin-binding protein 1B
MQRGFVVVTVLLLLVALIGVLVLGHRVTRQFEGRRWTLPARVYAQPVELYVGQSLSAQRFVEELDRLGYLAQANPERPGTYRRKGERVDLYLRAFRFSDGPQEAVALRIGFAGGIIASLTTAKGGDVPVIRLDPLLIGSIFPMHGEDRIVVAPDEVRRCCRKRSRPSRTGNSTITTA